MASHVSESSRQTSPGDYITPNQTAPLRDQGTAAKDKTTLAWDQISIAPQTDENARRSKPGQKGKLPAHRDSENFDGAWSTLNVLCFDGGGIRGIFSLLVLQRLMEYIRYEEESKDLPAIHDIRTTSSFSPCPLPNSVSHIPVSHGDPEHKQPFTPYLPCHYFDFICGTSTGGLITIMLSRLRMPVEDCLEEYKKLAGDIFGKPRHIHTQGALGLMKLTSRTKYDTQRLEDAIKDVLRRRGELAQDSSDMMLFQTQTGLCRSFVVSNQEKITDQPRLSQIQLAQPWIFRSYRLPSRDVWKDKLEAMRPRNMGQGTNIAAWKVARATTAAPLYFRPLRIYLDDGDVMIKSPKGTFNQSQQNWGSSFRPTASRTNTGAGGGNNHVRGWVQFTDGAFGTVSPANNPSQEALRELEFLKRAHQKIGTFISIGTSRRVVQPEPNPGVRQVLDKAVLLSQEVSGVHSDMLHHAENKGFEYFRLDDHHGLAEVGMDDWSPRNSGRNTLNTIEAAFNSWAAKMENINDLRECARQLVGRRRERSYDRSMWDRYAVGKYFVCNLEDCKKGIDETWNYKTSFEHHLTHDHRIQDATTLDRLYKSCEGGQWRYKVARV